MARVSLYEGFKTKEVFFFNLSVGFRLFLDVSVCKRKTGVKCFTVVCSNS